MCFAVLPLPPRAAASSSELAGRAAARAPSSRCTIARVTRGEGGGAPRGGQWRPLSQERRNGRRLCNAERHAAAPPHRSACRRSSDAPPRTEHADQDCSALGEIIISSHVATVRIMESHHGTSRLHRNKHKSNYPFDSVLLIFLAKNNNFM